MPLAACGGARYGLNETRVVKCVVEAGCVIGARSHIADKMSVDLSHVDRHRPGGDLARFLGILMAQSETGYSGFQP